MQAEPEKYVALHWRRNVAQPFEILLGVYGAFVDDAAAAEWERDFQLRAGERTTIEPLRDPEVAIRHG